MKASKKLAVLLGIVMSASTLSGLTACGGLKNEFTIRYYNGGYGNAWLKEAADEFGKANNVKVKLVPSADYDCGAPTLLKSGKNLPDLFIASSGTWREWVTSDYLENLTDVYESYTSCTDSSLEGYSAENGGQIKIKDYLNDSFVDYPYMQKRVGQGEFMPWVLQWSVQPLGYAYNTDILYSTTHYDSNGVVAGVENGTVWDKFPEKVSELLAYYKDIDTRNQSLSDKNKIIQYGWSGVQANTLFGGIYTWWAQAQGLDVSNYEGEGTFFDFFNYGNTTDGLTEQQTVSSSVFNQSGLIKAHETLQSIMVNEETKAYKNSDPKAQSMQATDVQNAFVAGKYAVMGGSSWLAYEMRDFLDTDKDGKQDVNFEYRPIPALDDYTGNQLTFCKIGDIMYVPKAAKNKDLAKKFLVFLSSEENNMKFTKQTGSIKPFQYNAFEKYPEHNWSDYTKSVFDTFYKEDTAYLYNYPKNTPQEQVSNLYRYRTMDFIGTTNVSTWLLWLKQKSASDIMKEIKKNVDNNITNWAQYYDMEVVD